MAIVNLGTHAIFDLEFPPNSKILKGGKHMMTLMESCCIEHGATVLRSGRNTFGNGGYTFFIMLAESHASCHTWPEYGLASLDIFMCGDDCDAWVTMDAFIRVLKDSGIGPTKYLQSKMSRGFIPHAHANANT